jgi:hypothetical protein
MNSSENSKQQPEDGVICTDAELATAIIELELAGLIDYSLGMDNQFRLTTSGIDYTFRLLRSLTPKDRVAILAFLEMILSMVELQELQDHGPPYQSSEDAQ